MRLEDRYYSDGRLRIRYYEGGRGKIAVFFHGGGLEAEAYKENINHLSEKYHVIAPDIPGFGKSDIPPNDWDFSDLAVYFKKFLEAKDIKNYYLIGYSYGGGIALNLAAIDQKKIRSMLLCSSAGMPRRFTKPEFVLLIIKEAFVSAISLRSCRQFKLFLMIAGNFIKNVILRKSFTRLHDQVIRSLGTELPNLKKIKIKTKIAWTYKDTFFKPEDAEKNLLLLPGSSMVKLDGTHLWVLLKKKEFEELASDL